MKITFLGTGTSQGIPVIGCECPVCQSDDKRDRRLRVAISIELQGKCLVIDSGPDFRYQMLRAGISRVDAILLTHEHRDHIGGLDDIRPFNFKYNMDMPVYATLGVQQALKKSFDYIFDNNYPGVPQVLLKTIARDTPFHIGDIKIIPIEYLHAKLPVLGFRIGNFAYITDIKTIEDSQLHYLEGLDILVLSALQHEQHYSHLTLEEALELTKKIGAKSTFFTHLSHTMGTFVDTEKLLPPNVYIAYDELVLELSDPEVYSEE